MEKLYSNARKQSYVTFYKKGYLRLPAKAMRTIKDKTGAVATDIYVDRDNKQLVLIPSNDGDYSLCVDRSGMMVCVYAARDCGIELGKHNYTLIEEDNELQLKVDFKAIQSV
jgi:hypothetical protein